MCFKFIILLLGSLLVVIVFGLFCLVFDFKVLLKWYVVWWIGLLVLIN